MRTARHQGNQGHQWLKINVDARRALSIIFLNLRFLLIELIFATHRDEYMYAARHQVNQVNQKTIKKVLSLAERCLQFLSTDEQDFTDFCYA